jgi:hypothetical protein
MTKMVAASFDFIYVAMIMPARVRSYTFNISLYLRKKMLNPRNREV